MANSVTTDPSELPWTTRALLIWLLASIGAVIMGALLNAPWQVGAAYLGSFFASAVSLRLKVEYDARREQHKGVKKR